MGFVCVAIVVLLRRGAWDTQSSSPSGHVYVHRQLQVHSVPTCLTLCGPSSKVFIFRHTLVAMSVFSSSPSPFYPFASPSPLVPSAVHNADLMGSMPVSQ